MRFMWRHYQGNRVLHEGIIVASCRVRAKRNVTYAIKTENVVNRDYKSKWREYPNYTITSLSDLRGIQYPMSSNRDFIVFFEPANEKAMINDLTNPKKKDDDLTLF